MNLCPQPKLNLGSSALTGVLCFIFLVVVGSEMLKLLQVQVRQQGMHVPAVEAHKLCKSLGTGCQAQPVLWQQEVSQVQQI